MGLYWAQFNSNWTNEIYVSCSSFVCCVFTLLILDMAENNSARSQTLEAFLAWLSFNYIFFRNDLMSCLTTFQFFSTLQKTVVKQLFSSTSSSMDHAMLTPSESYSLEQYSSKPINIFLTIQLLSYLIFKVIFTFTEQNKRKRRPLV